MFFGLQYVLASMKNEIAWIVKGSNHIPSDPRTQTGLSSLDGVAHLAFGHAYPWPCCGRLAIGESTTHPPTPPNNPSYPHTISGAPKLDKEKFQRYAYESNEGN